MLVFRLANLDGCRLPFISCGVFPVMSFCWLAGEMDKPYAGRHEDSGDNYICSSRVVETAKRAAGGICVSAKNIRFYQVGAEPQDAGCGKTCCLLLFQRSAACDS